MDKCELVLWCLISHPWYVKLILAINFAKSLWWPRDGVLYQNHFERCFFDWIYTLSHLLSVFNDKTTSFRGMKVTNYAYVSQFTFCRYLCAFSANFYCSENFVILQVWYNNWSESHHKIFAEWWFYGFYISICQSIECTGNLVLLHFLPEIKIPIFSTDIPVEWLLQQVSMCS